MFSDLFDSELVWWIVLLAITLWWSRTYQRYQVRRRNHGHGTTTDALPRLYDQAPRHQLATSLGESNERAPRPGYPPRYHSVRVMIGSGVMQSRASPDGVAQICDKSSETLLKRLGQVCEVLLLYPANSVEDAESCAQEVAAKFDVPQHRVLCYSTQTGKHAIVRQLAPVIYIDCDREAVRYIAPHIPFVVLQVCTPENSVDGAHEIMNAPSPPNSNYIVLRESLWDFFDAIEPLPK